jgi:hypothetical protein
MLVHKCLSPHSSHFCYRKIKHRPIHVYIYISIYIKTSLAHIKFTFPTFVPLSQWVALLLLIKLWKWSIFTCSFSLLFFSSLHLHLIPLGPNFQALQLNYKLFIIHGKILQSAAEVIKILSLRNEGCLQDLTLYTIRDSIVYS